MGEKKIPENAENLSAEELDQVTGGALWYDALEAIKSVRKGQEKIKDMATDAGDELAEKNGMIGSTLGNLSHGADQVRKRLGEIARHK